MNNTNFYVDTVAPYFDGQGVLLKVLLTDEFSHFIKFNAYYDDIEDIISSLNASEEELLEIINSTKWQEELNNE